MKTLHSQAGLTLVEALVAVTVLTVGVLGPLTIAARGISDGIFARNQIAANYLAQEGVEMVVNQRNEYYKLSLFGLNPGETIFDADLTGSGNPFERCVTASEDGAYCSVNASFDNNVLNDDCPTAQDRACTLVFDAGTNGTYLYQTPNFATGDQPIGPTFYRLIQMSYPDGDHNRLEVTVTVRWKNKEVDKELQLREYLFANG